MKRYRLLVVGRTAIELDCGLQDFLDDIGALASATALAHHLGLGRTDLLHRNLFIVALTEEGREIGRVPLDLVH
jgi:hypothetical protein